MDFIDLNFKHGLVILNTPKLYQELKTFLQSYEIDMDLKYFNSYQQAAKYILEDKSIPIDHVILNCRSTGKKFEDFIEFLSEQSFYKEDTILDFDTELGLAPIQIDPIYE